jgi:predicted nucleic acid-binding protein
VGLIDKLGTDGPIAIDTALFIYLIEEHPRYLPLVEPLFDAIDSGRVSAVTSAVTLLEVLVVPYRAGAIELAGQYEAVLTRSRGLDLIELSRAQLRTAAQLRAINPALRTPDALQLAAALAMRCATFITNDRRLPPLAVITIVQLDSC